VLARLVDEHGAADLSYSTVCDYVARRRPEIAAEAGKPLEAGFVPQTHLPAAEAEVDFHDLWVVLRAVKTKAALFTMRLSFSGRAVHRASLSQGTPARGRRICSSGWAPPPPRPATGSATPSRPSWSTSSRRPPAGSRRAGRSDPPPAPDQADTTGAVTVLPCRPGSACFAG
jgi:hypothetical protein